MRAEGEAQQALTLYDRSLEILEELHARLYLGRAFYDRRALEAAERSRARNPLTMLAMNVTLGAYRT